MQTLMKIRRKMIATIGRYFLKEKIHVGKVTYIRRLMLPILMSKTLSHEEFLDDVYIAALIKKEGAIINVGANTGQTLLKILSFDKTRPYFGFEPQITSALCVESFLIDNKIRNYCILPIALSDKNESIPLHIRGSYSKGSRVASMVDGFRPDNFYNYKRHIYAARGDEVIDSLGISSIALIKIDVEGAELEVIKGLRMTIEKHRPFILFEVLHHYLVMTKETLDRESIDFRESRIKELEEILRTRRYHIYQIIGNKEIIKIAKIEPKVVNDLASTNYIAVPDEKENDLCASLEPTRRITTG